MSLWDDEAGYDLDDPKHPTFYERYADWGDSLRKQRREASLSERDLSRQGVPGLVSRSESDCTCRRHAHDPDCNRHGQSDEAA